VAVILGLSLFFGRLLFVVAGGAQADNTNARLAIENTNIFFTVIPLKSVGMTVDYKDSPSVQPAQFDGIRDRQFCLSGP
jgi:hypothetical protein